MHVYYIFSVRHFCGTNQKKCIIKDTILHCCYFRQIYILTWLRYEEDMAPKFAYCLQAEFSEICV